MFAHQVAREFPVKVHDQLVLEVGHSRLVSGDVGLSQRGADLVLSVYHHVSCVDVEVVPAGADLAWLGSGSSCSTR